MNEAGSRFASGSGFTNNKDGHIRLRKQFSLGAKFLHHWAGADKECFFAQNFHVIAGAIACGDIVGRSKMPSNCTFKLLFVEWTNQEILGAEPYRFFFPADILRVREQNNRQFGAQPA